MTLVCDVFSDSFVEFESAINSVSRSISNRAGKVSEEVISATVADNWSVVQRTSKVSDLCLRCISGDKEQRKIDLHIS